MINEEKDPRGKLFPWDGIDDVKVTNLIDTLVKDTNKLLDYEYYGIMLPKYYEDTHLKKYL